MKRFADVHSATSPRSLSRITSSNPRVWADSSQVRFIAQERILVPVNWQAAWRASRTYPSLTPSPQCLESAVSAMRSLGRPLDGPAHMPPPLRTITMRSVQLGAWLASTSSSILRRTCSESWGTGTCNAAASRWIRAQWRSHAKGTPSAMRSVLKTPQPESSGEADRDIHRGDDQLGDLPESLDVEGVIRAQELEQVDARQVAGRVVQVDVLGAVRDDRSSNDIRMVAGLGQVVRGLESARLDRDHADGLVGVVPRSATYDAEKLSVLRGKAEPDQGAELAQRPADDPQIKARTVGAVADLGAILADIAEAVRLGSTLIDPARDAQ